MQELKGKSIGFLLFLVGCWISHAEWTTLSAYAHTGFIAYRPRLGATIYGQEAAFWHTAYFALGIWITALGIKHLLSRSPHA